MTDGAAVPLLPGHCVGIGVWEVVGVVSEGLMVPITVGLAVPLLVGIAVLEMPLGAEVITMDGPSVGG